MICRRCGMDSSTTDTCEWCKKPMLPPGGSISAKAKQEILKEMEQGTPPPVEEPTTSAVTRKDETELEAVIRRPEAAPPSPPNITIPGLTALGSHLGSPEEEVQAPSLSSVEQTTNDALLLPLGTAGTTAQSDDGSDQTIYIGNEQEVLRPIERPSKDGSRWVVDAAGRRKRIVNEAPEIPEKVRLMRGALQGGIVAFVLSMIQYFIYGRVPDHVTALSIADPKSFIGALTFSGLSAILMGFMLSALLVSFKKGPVFGFLLGFPLGWAMVSMAQDNPSGLIFPFITGCLCGIIVGRASVKGLKVVVSV